MPYFRISYKTPAGRQVSGIKEFHLKNIDDAFKHFNEKALKAQPDLTDFDCVMISQHSQQFKDWLAAKAKRRYAADASMPQNRYGPGRYRQDKGKEGPQLGDKNKG